jgi:hypothetical protein
MIRTINLIAIILQVTAMVIAMILDNIVLLDWCAVWCLVSILLIVIDSFKEKDNAICR